MTYTYEQLRQTQQLIDCQPFELVLTRDEVTATAAGGRQRGAPAPLAPQRVFFGAKSRDALPLQDNSGDRVVQYYTVVGMPGLDIQPGDKFNANGVDMVVTFVHRDLDYEVKADVESYGGGR